jgi:MoxR-like ATPase
MTIPLSAIETESPLSLKPPLITRHRRTSAYQPAAGLLEAIEVATRLGQPLLLTGDPGCGKTQAASWLAKEILQGAPLIECNVKSTSTGVDLLYAFDEVARFRDGARLKPDGGGDDKPLVSYLRLNGLGEAILRAAGGEAVLYTLTGERLDDRAVLAAHGELLTRAFGPGWTPDLGPITAGMLTPDDVAFANAEPSHCVLLIDELDKAPRDTPNDLLDEIEHLRFRIPELGLEVRSAEGRRPIVIITSNSEKALPDPFLRRCVYFDVPFPEPETLANILRALVDIPASAPQPALIRQTVEVFPHFRQPSAGLRKLPGTAELLAWFDTLAHHSGVGLGGSLAANADVVSSSLVAVFKSHDDLDIGRALFSDWVKPPGRT